MRLVVAIEQRQGVFEHLQGVLGGGVDALGAISDKMSGHGLGALGVTASVDGEAYGADGVSCVAAGGAGVACCREGPVRVQGVRHPGGHGQGRFTADDADVVEVEVWHAEQVPFDVGGIGHDGAAKGAGCAWDSGNGVRDGAARTAFGRGQGFAEFAEFLKNRGGERFRVRSGGNGVHTY